VASDGVWEFISSQEAAEIIGRFPEDATRGCEELVRLAKERWREHEGDNRDDITCIVAFLPFLEEDEPLDDDDEEEEGEGTAGGEGAAGPGGLASPPVSVGTPTSSPLAVGTTAAAAAAVAAAAAAVTAAGGAPATASPAITLEEVKPRVSGRLSGRLSHSPRAFESPPMYVNAGTIGIERMTSFEQRKEQEGGGDDAAPEAAPGAAVPAAAAPSAAGDEEEDEEEDEGRGDFFSRRASVYNPYDGNEENLGEGAVVL